MMLMWWNNFILFIIFGPFSNAKADDSSGTMTHIGKFERRQCIPH
jgi:hypothetical protein